MFKFVEFVDIVSFIVTKINAESLKNVVYIIKLSV